MSTKQETAFRIGSVYRDRSGRTVRLHRIGGTRNGHATAYAEELVEEGKWMPFGMNRLGDGRDPNNASDPSCEFTLLPGELHEVNGEWVPVSPLSGDAFDSQALEAARKCVAAQAAKALVNWVDAEILRVLAGSVIAAPKPASAPLEWNKPTPFDAWAGYSVTSSSSDPNHYRGSFGSPDLQKAEHQVSPMFGSAFLRG